VVGGGGEKGGWCDLGGVGCCPCPDTEGGGADIQGAGDVHQRLLVVQQRPMLQWLWQYQV